MSETELAEPPQRLQTDVPCVAFVAELAPGAELPRFRYVSGGCLRLFGVAARLLKDNRAAAFAAISDSEQRRLWHSFRAAARTRRRWRHEFPVNHGEGRRWIEAHASFALRGGAIRARGYFIDITAAKRARQESRRIQARFARVFAAETSAMAIVDDADDIVAVNPAFVDLFGYTREEIPSLSGALERVFPDASYRAHMLQKWQESFAGAADGALTKPVVGRIRRKDGTERVTEARTMLSGAERIVTFNDITARVHAEISRDQARRERDGLQMELQLQYERTPMALLVFDAAPDFAIRSWNPAAERIFGYRREEVIGRSPFEFLLPPDCRAAFSGAMSRGVGGEDTVHAVHQIVTKQGRTIWCECFNTALRDADGNVTRVLGMAQDVTGKLGAERERQLWSKVFAHSAEGIMICDPEQHILQVNGAFERITGYRADEVIGKDPRMLQSGRQDAAFYSIMWKTLRATGTWSGEIWNRRKNGELYLEWLSISAVRDEHQALAHYVGIFSDITARKSAEEHVARLAHFDALTDLPNRVLLIDRLEQAIKAAQREGTRVGVAFIDLDRFKQVNDSLGHNVGDALLQTVAQRLSGAVRGNDTVARMGGDEFVVVFQRLHDTGDATNCVGLLQQALRRPIDLEGNEVTVTASIGIAMFPQDGGDARKLLQNADAAMYQAKGEGRDRAHFYTGTLNQRVLNRLSVETALRRAFERQEFLLYFQPQVRVATGELVGAEALIRWMHPEQGLIMPSAFIPIAEESGLVRAIDDWVLEEAVRQCAAWCSAGLRSVPLAVNVSALPFHEKDFVERVARRIADRALDPGQLELELTESLMMRDVDTSVEVMRKLHGLGVRLAIDDFGTGYSSLSYLRRLPIQKVKIDRSFVAEMETQPEGCRLVRGIAGLASSLGLTVLAEGVETGKQLRLVGEQGCDEAQGFLFSQALPVVQFEQLVREWKPFGANCGERRAPDGGVLVSYDRAGAASP